MPLPRSRPDVALRIHTRFGHPRPAGVHFDTPLRPRASTRGSPVELIGSSPSFPPQPDHGSESSGSEYELQMRGRPSADTDFTEHDPHLRVGDHPGLVSTSVDRVEQPVVEQSPSQLQDAERSLKEPQPPERVHTNMFGILASSTTFTEMDLTRFGGHRDTLATFGLQRVKNSRDLPIEVWSYIARYLDLQAYKSVRLTCRCWSAAFTYVRPLRFPIVHALPAEIIKQIYNYLPPLDLNAARHTCQKWMLASLEYRVLAQVLKNAGLQDAIEADRLRNEQLGHPIGGEWRLSKRLATESSFNPRWTGNGFSDATRSPIVPITLSFDQAASNKDRSLTSIQVSCIIDFGQLLGVHQASPARPSYLRFHVSSCDKFLLVLRGSVIYVYYIRELTSLFPRYQHGGHLEFLVAIVCPGQILAVSMDTSEDRFTIAALLKDRVGLIMDVPELSIAARYSGSASPHSERATNNVTEAWELKPSPDATPTTSQRPLPTPIYTDIYHTSPVSRTLISERSPHMTMHCIPHTLYRNLCSKTSPPLSVAICPQRRCVAFGCSAGIELHWQDATTGQELSRWMEQPGPAEYIHFLSTRAEDEGDQARKLRLISSRSSPVHYHDPIANNDAWDYEHCRFLRAAPLSDGKHVLYTDPSTGDLCVGTGMHLPFGRPKPIRQFVLEGPQHSFEVEAGWATCYKASTELQWGARIVAGFGKQIWLFCIAPDLLRESMALDVNEDMYPRKRDGSRIIQGARIGEIDDLADLGVDASNGEVIIHAFSSSMPAKVFQIGRWPRREMKYLSVGSNGRVIGDDQDSNENLLMKGYVPDPERTPRHEHEGFGLKDTASRRADGCDMSLDGDDNATESSGVAATDIQKEYAMDWISDREEARAEDEGYESDNEDAEDRGHEWGWNDVLEEDSRGPDRSQEGNWDIMEPVRLEVEVVCGA
ncbi:MAG: hypothetical protein Q9219_005166 [cf. Caloplaca sp. 3 TL-2023]